MKRVVIFGGTTEGRELAETLIQQGILVDYCVATEYGEAVIEKTDGLQIYQGRMDKNQITVFLKQREYTAVVDATHPYAVEASKQISMAAEDLGIEVLRLKRAEGISVSYNKMLEVESIEAAVECVKSLEGNIFLSTGSKELENFLVALQDPKRVIVRVLPDVKVMEKCLQSGLTGKQIIAMQGPFSEKINHEMFLQTKAQILITKDGGKNGGYAEKINAAKNLGMWIVVIKRPEETGLSYQQVLKRLGVKHIQKRCVHLVGIGMGDLASRTFQVDHVIKDADLLIGAKRMIDSVDTAGKIVHNAYLPEEICGYLETTPFQKAVVLFSGDSGFYSGAKKLYQKIKEMNNLEVTILPGLSSVSCMAAKLGINYEDCGILSLHGRELPYINRIRNGSERAFFILLTNGQQISVIAKNLLQFHMKLRMVVGKDIGSEKELILEGCIEDFARGNVDIKESGNYLLYLEKEFVNKPVLLGLKDQVFLREQVPMTKEEIRAICLAKLQLKKDSILVDVGTGTGSIAIEAARMLQNGLVYGIEKKKEAVALIYKNSYLHGVDNLSVIEAVAPEGLDQLPTISHAFIGGSSGNLEEIVNRLLEINPGVRIVITAISIETIVELERLFHRNWKEKELIQVSVTKAKEACAHHLMMAQNPVWIGCLCNQ